LYERKAEVGVKVASVVEDQDCALPETAPTTVPATPTPNTSIPAKALSAEQVQKAVTSWFWTNVDPGFWNDVTEEISTQVYKFVRLPSKTAPPDRLGRSFMCIARS
jgi:hypothetical protein